MGTAGWLTPRFQSGEIPVQPGLDQPDPRGDDTVSVLNSSHQMADYYSATDS